MASKRKQTLQVVHPNCAGVDIGKKSHYVAVHESADTHSVRAFGCFTDELEDMAAWLESCAVDVVAMEATGVYWIPVYEVLDRAGFEVHLVDARATKQVSGRKSDVRDCQWIRKLMSYGLLRGAFRPRDEDCVVRSYVRQRGRLVRERARCVQHMQKALTQMNVQLDTVLNDVMGKSGEAIVRSIVGGERDATVLARMCDRRVKADMATIARALRGNWRAEHVFALSQALERHDFYADQIRAVEEQIVETLKDRGLDEEIAEGWRQAPTRLRRERALQRMVHAAMGVDLAVIPTIGGETALTVLAELGGDLSRFATSEQFCSWLNLAPGTRISGGKVLKGPAMKRVNPVGQALRMAASTARHNQSFIGACHRARLRRLDAARAVKATAHQLARLIYAMLTRGEEYVEKGMAGFETERRERQLRHLQRQAKHFNLTLVPTEQAA